MRKYWLLLAFTIIISACKSESGATAPASFSAASDTGLIAGTITFEGDNPVNEIYRFFYRPISGERTFIRKNSGKVMIKTRVDGKKGFNGDFNNKMTYFFVLEVKPGNYAFTQYNYLDHIGPTGMVSSSKEFSIPVEAKKGEISYIGELNYKDKAEPGTPRIFLSDAYERDKAELKNRYPNINWDSMLDKKPKSGNTGGGIIEFL